MNPTDKEDIIRKRISEFFWDILVDRYTDTRMLKYIDVESWKIDFTVAVLVFLQECRLNESKDDFKDAIFKAELPCWMSNFDPDDHLSDLEIFMSDLVDFFRS